MEKTQASEVDSLGLNKSLHHYERLFDPSVYPVSRHVPIVYFSKTSTIVDIPSHLSLSLASFLLLLHLE